MPTSWSTSTVGRELVGDRIAISRLQTSQNSSLLQYTPLQEALLKKQLKLFHATAARWGLTLSTGKMKGLAAGQTPFTH